MKSLILVASIFFTSYSFATTPVCEKTVSLAVKKEVKKHRQDSSQFRVEYVDCQLASNHKVYLCEVTGSNGDGAGDMSFLAVLSADCKKVYEVRLIGQE